MAHHSAVVFDVSKNIEITGTTTLFTLRNPHLILNMEVTNEEGEVELWRLEGQGISAMQAMGFGRGSINVGDEITVRMNPLRSGAPGGLVLGLIGGGWTCLQHGTRTGGGSSSLPCFNAL